jgi:hypothetical protein
MNVAGYLFATKVVLLCLRLEIRFFSLQSPRSV